MSGRQTPKESEQDWDAFRALLDEDMDWPGEFLFKFIIPRNQRQELEDVLPDIPLVVRASKRGNYVSVTAKMRVSSADEVIQVYRAAQSVSGVISL
jgi:uncharacterized protein